MSKPEVAIVGIGLHPFGRTPTRPGKNKGVYAVRKALADAGVEWSDVQFAFGGSQAAGNPDTMVSQLGLTGPAVHQRCQRLRHRWVGAVLGLQHHRIGRL